ASCIRLPSIAATQQTFSPMLMPTKDPRTQNQFVDALLDDVIWLADMEALWTHSSRGCVHTQFFVRQSLPIEQALQM
ncbi:hypothetical protein, partial [Rhizobium sp. Root1204]|uniref:hypothetical protein n=1 Tax=Rhizobium sp. Root1204 TaxID=1736428 RepID=UPI001AECD0EA